MPTLNIPPKIRFTLYILAALGSVFVVYAMDKNWAGEAEFKCWTGVAGLLSLLAASKTTTSDTGVVVAGTVEQTTTTTTEIDPDETGAISVVEAVLIGLLVILLLAVLGAFGPHPLR